MRYPSQSRLNISSLTIADFTQSSDHARKKSVTRKDSLQWFEREFWSSQAHGELEISLNIKLPLGEGNEAYQERN